jgi:hypothetical protein
MSLSVSQLSPSVSPFPSVADASYMILNIYLKMPRMILYITKTIFSSDLLCCHGTLSILFVG